MVAPNSTTRRIDIVLGAKDEGSPVISRFNDNVQRIAKDTGKTFGPQIKPRFSEDEQAIRDRQAGIVKAMRDSAKRANIDEEAKRRLFGDPAEVEKEAESTGRSAGEKTAHGFLESLKSQFGRGSTIKELGELALGGGVIAGFSILGEVANKAAESVKELNRDLHDTEKSGAEIASKFLQALPIIGGFAKAGANIREIFTREQEVIEATTKASESQNEAIDVQNELLKRNKEVRRDIAEFNQKQTDRGTIAATPAGLARETVSRQIDHRKEFDDAAREQEAVEERIRQGSDRIVLLQKKLADARQRAQQTNAGKAHDDAVRDTVSFFSGGLIDTSGKSPERIAADQAKNLEAQIASLRKLQAEAKSLSGPDLLKILNANAAEDLSAGTELMKVEGERREKESREHDARFIQDSADTAARIADIEEATREDSLRRQGRFAEAEILQIRALGEAKKKELEHQGEERKRQIDEQAADEIKRRIEAGEVPARAKSSVDQQTLKDKAEIDRRTADESAAIDRGTAAQSAGTAEEDRRERAKASDDFTGRIANSITRAMEDAAEKFVPSSGTAAFSSRLLTGGGGAADDAKLSQLVDPTKNIERNTAEQKATAKTMSQTMKSILDLLSGGTTQLVIVSTPN